MVANVNHIEGFAPPGGAKSRSSLDNSFRGLSKDDGYSKKVRNKDNPQPSP